MCGSPHTSSALDTACHNCLDERANVFVFHGSFALCETAPVTTKLHGLVLYTKSKIILPIRLVNLRNNVGYIHILIKRTYVLSFKLKLSLPVDHIPPLDHKSDNLVGG